MTVTSSPRLGLTRWSAGADPYTRVQRDGDNAQLDDLVAIDTQGVDADRPAAGTRGAWWYSTDTQRSYRDDGTAWHEVIALRHTNNGHGEVACLGDDAHDLDDDHTARLNVTADTSGVIALLVASGDAATGPSANEAVTVLNSDDATTVRIYGDGGIAAGRADVGTIVARDAMLTVRPTTTGERGLLVDHKTGATTDLIRASIAGTRRFTVDNRGRLYLSALSDNTAPATPGGAGVIYCNTVGDLLYKSPSGTVTTLANH